MHRKQTLTLVELLIRYQRPVTQPRHIHLIHHLGLAVRLVRNKARACHDHLAIRVLKRAGILALASHDVHRPAYHVLDARNKPLIGDRVDDLHDAFCQGLVQPVTAHLRLRADGGEGGRLARVGKVLVHRHHMVPAGERLEGNHRVPGKCPCVKHELHRGHAARLLGHEGCLARYGKLANHQRLACRTVHEGTVHHVLVARRQVLEANGVGQAYLVVCKGHVSPVRIA